MPAAELQGTPPTQKPLALYSGIVTVGADGTAEISFDIPEFAGTARVMAVAWSATKLGRATTDVIVRDPVVLTATLPRFLLTGDHGTMSMDLDNVEGAAGDYTVNVKAAGPVKVGRQSRRPRSSSPPSSAARCRSALDAGGAGTAQLDVDIKGPNGLALARHYALDVKPATQVLARRSIRTLAKGESLTLTSDMFSDLVPGTGSVSLSVGLSTALDAATILQGARPLSAMAARSRSPAAPCRCSMSTSSRPARIWRMDNDVDQRIKDAIERLLARQGSNGSFGLWSAGGDDAWLDAYVTDFLTRAREKGFAVPDVLFKSALDRIRNSVVNADEPEKDGGRNLAYGLYVLARNGAAPIGDLRYLADTKLKNLATPIAKSQLAAALALVGDRNRAERVYAAALGDLAPKPVLEFGRADYGSSLRDAAALVSLAAEGNAPRATLTQAVMRVEAARGLTPYTSTQENAWMVLAARALAKETMALDLNGQADQDRALPQLQGGARWRASRSRSPTPAMRRCRRWSRCRARRSRRSPRPRTASRSSATTSRSTASRPISRKAKQNDRFAVVLKVTEPKPEYGHIMVSDYLPAGFEIDNPHLVSSGDSGTLDWIEDGQEPVNTEFRDDRFTAALDRAARLQVGVHGGLCRARGDAGQIRAAAGLCRGHVQSLALRPHRHRIGRGASGEMSDEADDSSSCPGLAGHPRLRASEDVDGRVKPGHDERKSRGVRVTAALVVSASLHRRFAAWVVSLGPLPLAQARQVSTTIVDRNGKLLRAYAMADGRWRLPVDAKKDVDPTYLKLLLAYEDQRFYDACRRRSAGAGARRLSARHARPHRLRRLDHHHAARAADESRAHHRSLSAKLRQIVRAIEIERQLEQGRDPQPLSRAGAVRRQSRRHPRGLDRLFRQGAEAAVAGGSRAAGRAAAIAGDAPARPLSGCGARRARPRARPHGRGASRHAGRCRAGQGRRRCRSCASRCRSWRRIRPTRRSPTMKDAPVIKLTLDANLQKVLEPLARDRAIALGPEHLGRRSSWSTMRAATCSRASARPTISTPAGQGRST